MQADIDEELHILFEGELGDLLIQVEPSFREYVTYNKGKKTLYASLNKALYGTVQASLLFWQRLLTVLIDNLSFISNQDSAVVVEHIDCI
jgi:hypothetical protein